MLDPSAATILLVDDMAAGREALARVLRHAGFRVVEAATGGEALRQLPSRPDLVVLDVQLPDLSGLDVCRHSKSAPDTAATPVLLISGVATGTDDQVRGLEVADGYLVKPLDPAVLVAQVRTLLRTCRAERALANSEERFRALIENSADGIMLVGPDGTVLYDAPTAHRYLGYAQDEFLHRSGFGLLHPDDRDRVLATFARVAQEPGASASAEYRLRHRDGSWRWIEATGKNLIHNPAVKGIVINYRDITAAKCADDQLRRREEQLTAIVENTPECIKLVDANGRLVDINRAGLAMVEAGEKSEVVGQSIVNLVAPEFRERYTSFHRRICQGEKGTLEFDMIGLRGTRRTMEAHAAPLPFENGTFLHLSVTREITHRKHLEQQLLQAQRMEAVGQLAGGIAHEINNQMTVVEGFSELLEDLASLPAPAREYVRAVQRAGRRAANVAQQLLAFSRRQLLVPRAFCIADLVADLALLLRPLLPEDIELVVEADPNAGWVFADEEQLKQALLNLAFNARDAMPGGGRFSIIVRSADRWGPNAPLGLYVLVEVSDTGCGMDAATQARMFEPFFTTKAVGKGTGLGLSSVYGIVAQSGGHMEVRSAEGAGTTFQIYLPLHTSQAPTESKTCTPRPSSPAGNETILVVEDEPAVRTLVRHALQGLGYTVVEAGDGREALSASAQYAGAIHALVTDVVMPHLGGRELANVLRRQRPHLKVLYMSGHTDDTIVRHGIQTTEVAFLPKPFLAWELAQKLRDLLAGRSAEIGTGNG